MKNLIQNKESRFPRQLLPALLYLLHPCSRAPACGSLLLALLLAGIWLAACSPPEQNPGLAFEEAWVRAMPPGMKMTAAFGQLINSSEQAIEIIGFSSPSFGDVSLHRTEQIEGMSKMRPVSRLSIAPGDRVELAPGGYHLMLMMPTAAVEPGTRIVVNLKSAGGQNFSFNIPVEPR